MAADYSQIDEFIEELKLNPRSSGKLIKKLIQDSNRIFLNFPVTGRARKIAHELKKGPFSDFYIFERTLAHKLHPNLYGLNLNLFSNRWIQKHYFEKFKNYQQLAPNLKNLKGNELDILFKLKPLITSMVENDGHFMVAAFYDNHLKKINSKAASFFRALEISINFCKNALTGNKEENLNYIKGRLKKFFDIFKEQGKSFFLERLGWDDKLKEYYDLLLAEESEIGQNSKNVAGVEKGELTDDLQNKLDEALKEEGVTSSGNDKEEKDNKDQLEEKTKNKDEAVDDRIARYAVMIRDKYFNKINEKQISKFEKIINSIVDNNRKKFGEKAAEDLLRKLLNLWLNDPLIVDAKKRLLRNLLAGKFNITPSEKNNKSFDISPPQENTLQNSDMPFGDKNAINENGPAIPRESDETSGRYSIEEKENSELDHFEIKSPVQSEDENSLKILDQETGELEDGFEIKGSKEKDSADFLIDDAKQKNDLSTGLNIKNKDSSDLENFQISEKEESLKGQDTVLAAQDKEGQDLDLALLLKSKEAGLKNLEKYYSQAVDKANQTVKKLLATAENDNLGVMAIRMLNGEIFPRQKKLILAALEDAEGADSLFLKIIRYLENGPFPVMSLKEKKELLDHFIKKYQENKKLVIQLENYKKTLTSYKQLLGKVHEELSRIEKQYPGMNLCINEQLKFLDKLLHDEDYQPVWKTVMNIYRNIVNQLEPDFVHKIINDTRKEPAWKQTEILNYLDSFYRDRKDIKKIIKSRINEHDLKRYAEREEKQSGSKPPWIGSIIQELTGESIELKEWIERAASKKGQFIGFIKENDFSEKEVQEKFSTKINALLTEDKEKALNLFESILNKESLDPLAREKIIEKYADMDDPSFQALYNIHMLVDSVEGLEDKKDWLNEYKKIAQEQNLPPIVNEVLDKNLNSLDKDENKNKKNKFLVKELDSSSDKISFMRNLTDNMDAPDELRSTACKFNIAINKDQFKEAFIAISSSSNDPDTKIVFLEALKNIALNKGWIKDDSEDKLSMQRIAKIDNKISFYKNIVNGRIEEKNQIKEKKAEIINDIKNGKKIRKYNLPEQEKGVKKKEQKQKDEDELETEDMSDEERIYIRSMNIVKSFNDNIDALLPVLNTLVFYNQGDFRNRLKSQADMLVKNKKRLISQSIAMIKNNNADLDQLKEVRKAPAKQQYLWREAILKTTKSGKLTDAFKQFATNKEFMDEVSRISRIINSNNKNEFLKNIILKESKLINSIKSEFTIKNIRNLKTKTVSRQDKDKLSLFRDLLRLTGEKGVAKQEEQEEEKFSDNEIPGGSSAVKSKSEKETVSSKDNIYINEVKKEIDSFIKLCKSERTRNLAVKNSNRLSVIDNFFTDLISGNRAALNYARKNSSDVADLFSAIIIYKLNASLPAVRDALRFVFDKGIIRRSDLSL